MKKTKQNKTKQNNIRDTENYFQMRKVKSVFCREYTIP